MYIMVQTRTRTGRKIKKPDLYTPENTVLEDDYTLEEQKAEFDDMVKTNKLLPNSIPQRRKLNDFDKPKQEKELEYVSGPLP